MPIIKVAEEFTLTLQDQTRKVFKVGEHFVEDHVANHWWVKAHSTPVEPPVEASSEPPPPAAEAPPFEPDPDPEKKAPSKK